MTSRWAVLLALGLATSLAHGQTDPAAESRGDS
jgi:hypothetical protein